MATAAVIPVIPPGPPGQPDIAYSPDPVKYRERTKRRQETETLTKELPPGFPSKLNSDLVWDGATVSDEYEWSRVLSADELDEVDRALQHFKSLKKPLGELTQHEFPLPTLHDVLRKISWQIHNGHGFKVVRGIPVHKYTREENITIYAGLASHVATIRGRQDNKYNGEDADVVLAHIKDLSYEEDTSKLIGSPAYTTEKQVYHTDSGDIIALFALGAAAEGGESFLASSWKVYNEIASTRPDLIATLAEPWPFDEFGKTAGSKYVSRALFHHQPAEGDTPERVILQYARRVFTGYWGLPRSADIPPLTEAQAEALDALHYTAEKYRVSLDFHAGDIQFVNNLSIMHSRGSFRDSETSKRHLVRLWLRDEELAWKTPDSLRDRWARVYENVRPEKQVFPLEPAIRGASRVKATEEAQKAT